MSVKMLLGSDSYGIGCSASDVDIGVLGPASIDRKDVYRTEKKLDILPSSHFEFMADMLGPNPRWFFTQFLFPEKFIDTNELSSYLMEKRSEIVQARLPVVYKTLKHKGDGMRYFADKLYDRWPKRMAYSTLFYSMLANHAEGMPFAQAHKPEGELHDFLISMREGKIPLEDALARNELERLRAEKAAGFYKEAVHPEMLREFEQVILDQAKKERSD